MILLDTHVLVMLALKPEGLSRAAQRVIARAIAGSGVAIASITLWEIALLIDAGRIVVRGSTEAFLRLVVQRPGLRVIDLNPEIAALAFQFPPGFPRRSGRPDHRRNCPRSRIGAGDERQAAAGLPAVANNLVRRIPVHGRQAFASCAMRWRIT